MCAQLLSANCDVRQDVTNRYKGEDKSDKDGDDHEVRDARGREVGKTVGV